MLARIGFFFHCFSILSELLLNKLGAFFLLVAFSVPVFSISVSEPEFRTASHCDSAEDYERSKMGGFSITSSKIDIKSDKLIIRVQVVASQCQKLRNNRYQWIRVSPIGKISYQHSYFDTEKKVLIERRIFLEHKGTWVSVANKDFSIVGKSDVSGTINEGFFAHITAPLAGVATPQQLTQLRQGESQDLSVNLFVKSFFRYIVSGKPEPYEESSGAGLYQVNFTVHNANGFYTID